MFLLSYGIFFLNIVFVIRYMFSLCQIPEEDLVREFIGKNKKNDDDEEDYEETHHESFAALKDSQDE